MQELLQIIDIVNKAYIAKIRLEDYREHSLFQDNSYNEFRRYILAFRINVFLRLAVVSKFLESDFIIGNEECTMSRSEEEIILESVETGPTLANNTFSGRSVFDYLLSTLGLPQIITTQGLSMIGQKRLDKDLSDPKKNFVSWSEYYSGEVFILRNYEMIITESIVYIKKNASYEEEVKKILMIYSKPLKDFLDKNKNAKTIDHEIYIKWLLAWFPCLISIRSLEDKSSG